MRKIVAICSVTVGLAIPLLLFSIDVGAWLRLARGTVLSFFICMFSVMVMSALVFFLFGDALPEARVISSMLVGVYVGGTPNMAAIGTALGVKPETFILVNAADVVVCIVYLLLLLTVGGRLLVIDHHPSPSGGWPDLGRRMLSHLIEMSVGWEHHSGYRSFIRSGGLPALLGPAGLVIDAFEPVGAGRLGVYVARKAHSGCAEAPGATIDTL